MCPKNASILGIDVSKWQADIDWMRVRKSGVKFAYIRVSHGLEGIDERFDENWLEAKKAKIQRGAYQYYSISQDPILQADLMVERMGPLDENDLAPVIDVEDEGLGIESKEEYESAIAMWLDRVEEKTGVRGVVYTNQSFWRKRVNTRRFENTGSPLWFANYETRCPTLPRALTKWDIWQFSSTGKIPGIAGPVDLNRAYSSLSLRSMSVGASTCGDGICTGSETNESCSIDCLACATIPAEGRAIDDGDRCVAYEGLSESLRWSDEGGYGGGHRWARTWESAEADVTQTTTLRFDVDGVYALDAYIPASHSRSAGVKYRVWTDDSPVDLWVDQAGRTGWSEIGQFVFRANRDYFVEVFDNTGERGRRVLTFDALRVRPGQEVGAQVAQREAAPASVPALTTVNVVSDEPSVSCSSTASNRGRLSGVLLLFVGMVAVRRRA